MITQDPREIKLLRQSGKILAEVLNLVAREAKPGASAEFLDVYVFSWIRQKLGKSKLWLRNNVSNFISQFVDSALFLTIAFYAFNQSFGSNLSFITGLLIPYWLLRCGLSIVETPLVYLGVKWLKGGK